jgi:hypothetical protein
LPKGWNLVGRLVGTFEHAEATLGVDGPETVARPVSYLRTHTERSQVVRVQDRVIQKPHLSPEVIAIHRDETGFEKVGRALVGTCGKNGARPRLAIHHIVEIPGELAPGVHAVAAKIIAKCVVTGPSN